MVCLGRTVALIAVALLAASCVRGEVVDATDATLDQVVASGELVLVNFYQTWCGHCKRIATPWAEASEQLKGTAVLARLDCGTETASAKRFNIQSYPTIIVFRDGQPVGGYDGGRTTEAIVRWVRAHAGPAVQRVASAAELAALKAEHPVLVVAFAADAGTNVAVTHAAVAKTDRAQVKFALVTDPALRGEEAPESIVVFKQFDEGRAVFDGDASDESALRSFLAAARIRVFDEMGPSNYRAYVARKLPIAWLFVRPSDAATAATAKAAAEEAAAAFRGRVSFVWVDADKFGGMAQRVALKGDKFPAFAVERDSEYFTLPDDAEMAGERLRSFVEAVLAGTVARSVRSEAAPAEHTTMGVTTVVGSTFDELVTRAGVDVFLMFGAPYCSHCKAAAPKVAAAAAALAKTTAAVRVATIDATANDFDTKRFAVSGFPTFYFIPANGGDPTPYEGARTPEAIVAFIHEKATKPFEKPEM